ncbi:MAG: HAD family hydrolase [Pseudobdellovibrionaceae bacterium]
MKELKSALSGKTHIIWDWNGTLLDDVDHAVQTANWLLKEHGLPFIDRQKYRECFGFPVLDYYKALGFDFERESFESLCHRFVDRFMNGISDLIIIPEMHALVKELHQERIHQSVLSASDQVSLDRMVSHYELGDYFRFVFGIENRLAGSKIDRGVELIRNSNVPKSRTVIVGDTIHDLEVAQALGIDAVLISHGHQSADRLRARHDKVIVI